MEAKEKRNPDFVKAFERSVLIVGGIIAAIGLIGIILPHVMAVTMTVFLGIIMIASGVFFGYYSFHFHAKSFVGWFKPVVLVIVGVMMVTNPKAGIAAVTLLITLYLFMDAYAGFGLAHARYPRSGWGWFLLNGILSLFLAVLMLMGWPTMSPFFLGLYIGVSLLFDGISLFMLGMKLQQQENGELREAL